MATGPEGGGYLQFGDVVQVDIGTDPLTAQWSDPGVVLDCDFDALKVAIIERDADDCLLLGLSSTVRRPARLLEEIPRWTLQGVAASRAAYIKRILENASSEATERRYQRLARQFELIHEPAATSPPTVFRLLITAAEEASD